MTAPLTQTPPRAAHRSLAFRTLRWAGSWPVGRRFGTALVLGAGGYWLAPLELSVAGRAVVGWDAFALASLAMIWCVLATADAGHTRAVAARESPGPVVAFVFFPATRVQGHEGGAGLPAVMVNDFALRYHKQPGSLRGLAPKQVQDTEGTEEHFLHQFLGGVGGVHPPQRGVQELGATVARAVLLAQARNNASRPTAFNQHPHGYFTSPSPSCS